ncbi:TTF-type domain-containing protein [Citrus sinensis]|uniref:TTF-type domain-containing protein n=1 Tax=Citrus sinensis TaxID=2711 RepID=A0ACB8MWB1_CITSI|nr:TTF-type domain-containing protein [Citrus sinensis]KAH9789619.1 TTF-type domain-containing protein [Citrus sinensis]
MCNIDASSSPPKSQRVEFEKVDTPSTIDTPYLERDPGLRFSISTFPIDKREDVRMAYINMGPFQPKLQKYPLTKYGMQNRRFQFSWFSKFPWLEYSISKDKAFCFPWYIFHDKPSKNEAFVVDGVHNWKYVGCEKTCPFAQHEGGHGSSHNDAMLKWSNLKDPSKHIDKRLNAQSSQQILENRLRLKTSIVATKWSVKQACAFRGHDESVNSLNRGNFIELIKLLATMNEEINKVVLANAPKNAQYIAPKIQKELLNIISNKVRHKIREEVGDAKFCIIVDEALDESHKEQMAIFFRYVDCDGFIRERFFEIVNVDETKALTLKNEKCNVLAQYNLLVKNLRGQGYDGASNMAGEWNGLQSLFLNDCLASFKRYSELKSAREKEIIDLIALEELETGTGANQVRTLQRAGDTRWSSHFTSVSRFIEMFGATLEVLGKMINDGSSRDMCGEAKGANKEMKSFEFVFILFLLNKVLRISDILCRALQTKSLDILNTLNYVSSTKRLLQEFRDNGWDDFIRSVVSFCEKYDITMLDMSDCYIEGTWRSCQQKDYITVEHHYHFDVFNAVIDFQLMELNSRFSEQTVELLTLSSALDPVDGFKSFDIDNICSLAKKFYPHDFTPNEVLALRRELEHYQIDVLSHPQFQNMASLSELCRRFVETMKSQHYLLIDRLIRLVLTLLVSTATTERAFSTIKLIKTSLHSKMENEFFFFSDSMVIYVEREIIDTVDSNSVIDDFYNLKPRKVQLR